MLVDRIWGMNVQKLYMLLYSIAFRTFSLLNSRDDVWTIGVYSVTNDTENYKSSV